MRNWLRRYGRRTVLVLAVAVVAFVGWNAMQVYLAWRSIDRVDFDLAGSRAIVDELARSQPDAAGTDEQGGDGDLALAAISEPQNAQTVFDDDRLDVFLVIGVDADSKATDLGRADAVLLFVRPEGGGDPLLMSLPRDLNLVNPCTRRPARLTATLEGCGEEVSGPELLALMVENFTTLEVDHFAVVSFGAFQELIDLLGGIEICVDHETRFYLYTLPAGCSLADGFTALAWVRTRTPEERVDGEWQAARGGDTARSERQQQLLIELLRRLKRFRSPLDLASLVDDISTAIALDETLSIGGAIDMAWEMRSINPNTIKRPVLPVRDQTLQGKFVRVPTQAFPEFLADVYGSG